MFKGNLLLTASLSLTLLFSASALAQGNAAAAKAKPAVGRKRNNGKNARYANQEVSYRQSGTGANHTQSSATTNQPGTLKKSKPKQQNLLPYMEQGNLRRHRNTNRR